MGSLLAMVLNQWLHKKYGTYSVSTMELILLWNLFMWPFCDTMWYNSKFEHFERELSKAGIGLKVEHDQDSLNKMDFRADFLLIL